MADHAAEISLPLLARELTELAARRRTYLVRVLYAAALLFAGWMAFEMSTMHRSTRAIDYLGSGALLLWWTGFLQNYGLLIVLPALTCDVFTREKERQTLGLLFLTRLTPPVIVLEKFVSRLFPAACLLLISLPMLAFSYSFGGVESWQVANTAIGLLTNAITLTAIAVMCSSLCHTTTAAFAWTYVLITLTPLMVLFSGGAGKPFDFLLFGKYFSRALYLNPPYMGAGFGRLLPSATDTPLMMCVNYAAACLPSLVFAAFYLLVARWFLISRSTKKPREARQWLPSFLVRGLAVASSIHESPPPDLNPVAWREIEKRLLSRGLLRWTLTAVLLLVVCGAAMLTSQNYAGPPFARHWQINTIALLLWLVMLFVLTAVSANLITQERGQQTLHVLLTTPLEGAQIVRQKLVGIQRLLWAFLIPLALCLCLRMMVAMPKVHRMKEGSVDYPLAFFNEATMLLIYPQVVIWMALYFSLKSKTTIAAIMKTVLTIAGMCIGPWVILMLIALAQRGLNESGFFLYMVILMFGPADLLLYGYSTDCIPPGFDSTPLPLLINTVIHGGLWWRLRTRCLTKADRLLGRGDS